MQVDLSTVLGLAASAASIIVGAWLAIIRYAIAQREREIERRLDDCRDETRKLSDRLHAEEKATIRQDGDVKLVRGAHENLAADIEEIKRTMATKTDTSNLDRHIQEILTELRGARGRQPSHPDLEPPSRPSRKL
jgi:DNA repair exonuclease SbcCD ATPase subunit